jgi:iron complex outermembrane receptor protein
MRSSQKKPGAERVALRTQAFRLSPIAAGCAALVFSSGAVYAQAAPEAGAQNLDTVVVTGIRKGIEDAISIKKSSDNIVEAISAEDIGKLPDASIADSISRLPGVAVQHTNGRARQISIRGMSPDFSTSLLNGREQASTGDSRSAEFDMYPSELLSAVVVYKTPDAALVGQGLAGTVDLQTVRPLSFAKREIAVNYRETKSGLGMKEKGDGERMTLSYIDQFADRKIGIALGFAHLKDNGAQSLRFDNWGGGTTTYNAATVNVPYNGFGYWAEKKNEKRDGFMGVLQFKPSSSFSSVLDLFYSKDDTVKSIKAFQAPLNDSWAGGQYDTGGVLSNAVLSGNNVTSGTFNNVRAVVRNDAEETHDKLKSIGWNNKFKFSDTWSADLDLNYGKAERTGGYVETYAGTTQATLGTAQYDSVAFTNNAQFTPGLNYTDRNLIRLTDVQGWDGGINSPQAGYAKLPVVEDKIEALRFSMKHTLGDQSLFSAYEFGGNYTDRKKSRAYTEFKLVVPGADGLASAAIPGTGTTTVAGIPIATFDPVAAMSTVYNKVTKLHPDIYNKDWRVEEKVATGFAKLDLDNTFGGLPVRGNVGLQVVHTDQSSTAFNVDRNSSSCASSSVCPANELTAGTQYHDVLPSSNFAFDIGNDQVVRLALARVMARPTISDMRASSSIDIDATNVGGPIYTGNGGNPLLKPFRANAADLSFEKYFGTKAYIGAAVFYKDLSTYIVTTTVARDFSNLVTPAMPVLPSTIGKFTQPINGSGGKIKGLELTASLPFNMFSKTMDGFGIEANYSNNLSDVKLPASGMSTDGLSGSIPLPGLSRRVTTLVLYFEKAGFSARMITNRRTAFLGEVSGFTGDRQLTYVQAATHVDAQVGYEIQSGPVKGLSITAQAYNIGNTPFIRYKDVPTNIVENTRYGATYMLGLNYKM